MSGINLEKNSKKNFKKNFYEVIINKIKEKMTIDEIKNKAKFLLLPNDQYKHQSKFDSVIDGREYIELSATPNDRYTTYTYNSHHYTTKYHIEVLIPSLAKLLGF